MIKELQLICLNAIYTYKGRMWLSAILTAICACAYNEYMYPILSDAAFVFLAVFLIQFAYWIYKGIKNELE
jgi:hypothetical protein